MIVFYHQMEARFDDPSILVSLNVYLGVTSILTTTIIFPGFKVTCRSFLVIFYIPSSGLNLAQTLCQKQSNL